MRSKASPMSATEIRMALGVDKDTTQMVDRVIQQLRTEHKLETYKDKKHEK